MLAKLLGTKYNQFISNVEVWRLSQQLLFTLITQAWHVSLFGHIIRVDDNADAKRM